MTQFQFKKAERKGIFARFALDGPTGSGKTYSALAIAQGLKGDKRVAVIDTERSSSDRYADIFDFDNLDLETHSPDTYVEALKSVNPEVQGVVIVDSLSHAWMGRDGALEQVDKAASRSQSGNKFVAWRDVTPMHNRLVDALLSVQAHLIVTMRSKMEYVLEDDGKGRKVPRKVGMAPIQREGTEFEFDIVGDMNLDNELVITKTRASFLNKAVIVRPDAELGRRILEWCGHVEPHPTDDDLRALAALGAEHGLTVDGIKALSPKPIRDLTLAELAELREKIKGA